ncbi:MAG: hypothetical protein HW403_430, partial [Dehalococcoidia bacterium]|nr:hypothetical protein [Dehalococcoidia bacterium]
MRSTFHLSNLASVAIALALVGSILFFGYRGWSGAWSALLPPFNKEARPELVYSELLGDVTVLWVAMANDPKSRLSLGSVNHQQGYGIRGSVSPDGEIIAYTVLPPGAADPSSMAALWLLDRAKGQQRMILEGVDVRGAPVWAPDSARLLVKSTHPSDQGDTKHQIILVELESWDSRGIVTSQGELGFYPIGWAMDGAQIYYASLTERGTFVNSFDIISQGQRTLFQASPSIARDFHLSTDGAYISYSAEVSQIGGTALRLMKANADGSSILDVGAKEGDSFGPAWRPHGGGLTFSTNGRLIDRGESGSSSSFRALTSESEEGSMVPLAWSPDGRYLAARHLEGVYPLSITGESLVVIDAGSGAIQKIEAKG